jgi:hypothetical protein
MIDRVESRPHVSTNGDQSAQFGDALTLAANNTPASSPSPPPIQQTEPSTVSTGSQPNRPTASTIVPFSELESWNKTGARTQADAQAKAAGITDPQDAELYRRLVFLSSKTGSAPPSATQFKQQLATGGDQARAQLWNSTAHAFGGRYLPDLSKKAQNSGSNVVNGQQPTATLTSTSNVAAAGSMTESQLARLSTGNPLADFVLHEYIAAHPNQPFNGDQFRAYSQQRLDAVKRSMEADHALLARLQGLSESERTAEIQAVTLQRLQETRP